MSAPDWFAAALAYEAGDYGEFLRLALKTADERGSAPVVGITGAKSRGRPRGSLAKHTVAIRDATLALAEQRKQMTVRGCFYALEKDGVVPKDETRGYRPVQRQVLALRREGLLPWSFIADGTRWVRKASTFDSVEDALHQTARLYRRDLWASQGLRVEIWLEKDALADLIWETADRWGVPLFVTRGVASATYIYSAAEQAREDDRTTFVFTLFDQRAAPGPTVRSSAASPSTHPTTCM